MLIYEICFLRSSERKGVRLELGYLGIDSLKYYAFFKKNLSNIAFLAFKSAHFDV